MINIKRLMENLESIGNIGREDDKGISRLAFSNEYYKAIERLESLAKSKGFKTNADSIGNLTIEYNPDNIDEFILLGSHLDTVKNGGLYDGALGVFVALEILETIVENDISLKHGIKIMAFNAEEGSEMGGTFGSRTICNRNNLSDDSLADKLKNYDLTINDLKNSVVDLSHVKAFLELHIEQGGVLDTNGLDIGVVNGIVGITRYDLKIYGEANHAGTTPMALRDDPIKKLSYVLDKMYEISDRFPHPFVMTIGNIVVTPGMYNIIPNCAELKIEVRDLKQDNIDKFFNSLNEYLKKSNLHYSLIKNIEKPSVQLDKNIVNTFVQVLEETKLKFLIMSSGAGHDAKELSHIVPTGMLFVPSIGGVSHSPEEYTSEEQIEIGTKVLLQALLKLDEEL